MKAFSHINIGEKISFIIGCKNYLILVVSKKTDIPCANCTRPCAQCTSFNLALQASYCRPRFAERLGVTVI